VNLNEQSIRFDEAGVELDLGSIGKGYALDRCAELLEARGVRRFLIQGGLSSVLARGGRTNAGTPWQVDLHHPYRPQVRLGCLRLTDRALGTSGSVKQNRLHNGERLGHILDPRSGWPACQLLSATALADRAATADALATAFFVMGVEATQRYCHEHPEIGAVLVCESDNNGPIVTTCGLDRVEWQPV
jgi:thiamine biosynthesis lipoprotein